MSKYIFSYEEDEGFTDSETVSISTETNNRTDLIDVFERFLKACGYHFEGALEVIEEGEIVVDKKEYLEELNALEQYRMTTEDKEWKDVPAVSNIDLINKTLKTPALSLTLVEEKLRKYSGNLLDASLVWEVLNELDEELS